MKNTVSLIFALLLILASCSESTDVKKTTKKRDQPNLDQVTPVAKPEKKVADVNREPSSPEELKKANAVLAAVTDADIASVDGRKVFKSYCAICHGITGDLNVNGATDLTTSTLSIEERVAQVYHGRGLMTPFNGLLKDKEIVAVTKYLEELR